MINYGASLCDNNGIPIPLMLMITPSIEGRAVRYPIVNSFTTQINMTRKQSQLRHARHYGLQGHHPLSIFNGKPALSQCRLNCYLRNLHVGFVSIGWLPVGLHIHRFRVSVTCISCLKSNSIFNSSNTTVGIMYSDSLIN